MSGFTNPAYTELNGIYTYRGITDCGPYYTNPDDNYLYSLGEEQNQQWYIASHACSEASAMLGPFAINDPLGAYSDGTDSGILAEC